MDKAKAYESGKSSNLTKGFGMIVGSRADVVKSGKGNDGSTSYPSVVTDRVPRLRATSLTVCSSDEDR